MTNRRNRFMLMMFGLLLTVVAQAQTPRDISPFSRLGLGDFYFQNTITTAGMGGFGAAFHTPSHINLANPASLGRLRTASFEAGVFMEGSELEFDGETAESLNGNITYLSLGFALQNRTNEVLDRRDAKVKWGMNFALIPYTTVGYDVRFLSTDDVPGLDTVRTRTEFRGSGGTNRVVWSNGVQFENLSIGATVGVLFGNLENNREVQFLNVDGTFGNTFSDDININGFIYDLGAQYEFQFKKDQNNPKALPQQSLTIGIVGHTSTQFTTKTTQLRTRTSTTLFGLGVLDTIQSVIDFEQQGKLPAQLTLGLAFRNKTNFYAGLDYTYSDWSSFENPATEFVQDEPVQLNVSHRLAGGVQWTPNDKSYNRYLKRVSYRLGGYFFDDPRLNDLKTYAVTFGAGFPIVNKRRAAYLNLAVELGQQNSDTIDEQFWRVSLGFTLNDNSWFFKRKFN